MSTLSGKPPHPIDLTGYVSQKVRERSAAERPGSEHDDGDPLRSPYAPKRAIERSGGERAAVESEHDPARSPYAPAKARTPGAADADLSVHTDTAPLAPARAPDGPREQFERHAIGPEEAALCPDDAPASPPSAARDGHRPAAASDEYAAGRHPMDLEPAAPLEPPEPPYLRRNEEVQRRDEVMSNRDLDRLEASLRWLQQQGAQTRLPRAAAFPAPEPNLASFDARARRHDGDRSGLRAPLSLEPERLVPPTALRSRGSNLRWPLRILIVSSAAVPILYYFTMVGSAPPDPAPLPQVASASPLVAAPPPALVPALAPAPAPAAQREPRPAVARDEGSATQFELSSQRGKTSRIPRPSEGENVAALQPGTSAAEAASPGTPARALDPAEIALLVKQGGQFIASGDLVTARLVFQRAAEAGDAGAALALAATYDPNVLSKLGVVGMGADVAKARGWYEKAESLGSAEARRRLEALAGR